MTRSPAPFTGVHIRRAVILMLGALLLFGGCRRPPASPPPEAVPPAGWVLTVRDDGPRWLGPAWWQARGVDVDTLGPERVRLMHAGEPAPHLWLDAPAGPGLLFFGQTDATPLGHAAAYTLTLDAPGAIMPAATLPEPAGAPQSATWDTVTLERDLAYRTTAPAGHTWLWQSLIAPDALTLTVPLTDVLPATPVTLTVTAWGQSRMPVNPDHHARLIWNGAVIDDHWWDGNALEVWTATAPAARAENTLVFATPGETEAAVEVTWLDAIYLTWRRALGWQPGAWQHWQAESAATACFTSPLFGGIEGGTEGMARGMRALFVLPDGRVLDGGARAPVSDELCLPQIAGARGWLGSPWDAPPPDHIRARQPLDVQTLAAADYLVVAAAEYHTALAPLLAAREAEGLIPALITPEQVYDTWGAGLPSAAAIRRMARALHVDGALDALLLVGDASADPRAHWQNPALIPTGWVRTGYVGETPSDHWLIADDAGAPLVGVGRFPAESVAEVEAMVAKTLAWEPTPRLLLLNDVGGEFVSMTDALAEFTPDAARLDVGDANARREVLNWLREPGTLVYSGHGSLPMLSDRKILTREDAGAWPGPTVVIAWTCLCATFTHPTQAGLSEAWLKSPQGAAAFVGPTGETTTAEQAAMARALQEALSEGETLGAAMARSWHAAQSTDARVSFLLLGDPALRPMP